MGAGRCPIKCTPRPHRRRRRGGGMVAARSPCGLFSASASAFVQSKGVAEACCERVAETGGRRIRLHHVRATLRVDLFLCHLRDFNSLVNTRRMRVTRGMARNRLPNDRLLDHRDSDPELNASDRVITVSRIQICLCTRDQRSQNPLHTRFHK